MSETAPERKPAPKKEGKKYGGLPGWAWFAIAGGAVLIWWVWRHAQQSQQAQQQNASTPFGPTSGRSIATVPVPTPTGPAPSNEELQDILTMDRRIWEAILDLQGQEAKEMPDKDKTDKDKQRKDDEAKEEAEEKQDKIKSFTPGTVLPQPKLNGPPPTTQGTSGKQVIVVN